MEAIGESIMWVCQFENIVEENYIELKELIEMNDAIATSRFMRQVLF
ncbi:hypothetical protein SDC9_146988 [bioreactor metagenome]|uniref:Uncharacterized protein n=1 Tax=bioreactor metagenome TaxID=1076179 RepID=A0A645ECN1_9ZZZZ